MACTKKLASKVLILIIVTALLVIFPVSLAYISAHPITTSSSNAISSNSQQPDPGPDPPDPPPEPPQDPTSI